MDCFELCKIIRHRNGIIQQLCCASEREIGFCGNKFSARGCVRRPVIGLNIGQGKRDARDC